MEEFQLKEILREIFQSHNIAVIMTTWIFLGAVGQLFWAFSSDYMRKLGASPRIIGLLNSTIALISMLVMIPGGNIADKRGRKDLVAWGIRKELEECKHSISHSRDSD